MNRRSMTRPSVLAAMAFIATLLVAKLTLGQTGDAAQTAAAVAAGP